MIFVFGVGLVGCKEIFQGGQPTELIKEGVYSNDDLDLYCIIKNQSITISKITKANAFSDKSIISDTYIFQLENGSYRCENVRNKISFKLFENKLLLYINEKKFKLSKNKDIQEFDNQSNQLEKPDNIIIDSTQIYWYKNILDPYYEGILNVCIELKENGTENYNIIKFLDFIPAPTCMYYLDLKNLQLNQGRYMLRISYSGGYYLKDNKIFTSLDSEPIYLSIEIDNENVYSILMKEEVLDETHIN